MTVEFNYCKNETSYIYVLRVGKQQVCVSGVFICAYVLCTVDHEHIAQCLYDLPSSYYFRAHFLIHAY